MKIDQFIERISLEGYTHTQSSSNRANLELDRRSATLALGSYNDNEARENSTPRLPISDVEAAIPRRQVQVLELPVSVLAVYSHATAAQLLVINSSHASWPSLPVWPYPDGHLFRDVQSHMTNYFAGLFGDSFFHEMAI